MRTIGYMVTILQVMFTKEESGLKGPLSCV